MSKIIQLHLVLFIIPDIDVKLNFRKRKRIKTHVDITTYI